MDDVGFGEMDAMPTLTMMVLLLQRGGESAEAELAGASPKLFQPCILEVLRRSLLMLSSIHNRMIY